MVVRVHAGYIPGFPVWVWVLWRVFRILLFAAGNIAHSSHSASFGRNQHVYISIRVCLSLAPARVIISLGCFGDAGPGLSVVIRLHPIDRFVRVPCVDRRTTANRMVRGVPVKNFDQYGIGQAKCRFSIYAVQSTRRFVDEYQACIRVRIEQSHLGAMPR